MVQDNLRTIYAFILLTYIHIICITPTDSLKFFSATIIGGAKSMLLGNKKARNMPRNFISDFVKLHRVPFWTQCGLYQPDLFY